MITTNNDDLAEKCRRIRNCGCKYFKDPDILGFNLRMTEAQAAMGVIQLSKLDMFNNNQIRNAEYAFKQLPNAIMPPYVEKNMKSTFYIIGCQFNEEKAGMTRNEFVEKVAAADLSKLEPGETVGGGYSEVIYDLPYFQKHYPMKPKQRCVNAENLIKSALWFDRNRYPHTISDMQQLIDGFKKILGGS